MKSPLGFIPTILFASFLFLSSTQFIQTTCNETKYSSVCMKTLTSDPRATNASTYKELAPIAFDLAITYANQSQTLVAKFIKAHPSEGIKSCQDECKTVMMNLRNAKEELIVDNDATSASYDVQLAATDAIRVCEAGLRQGGVEIPELSAINNEFNMFISLASVVIDNY